ncbi:hypothetical protein BDZ94DRAFT_1241480 [Collybia nuda]|uniref:Uncharacterized protein n=1 Tax=Collybia nuda TaxID=64659 RepID=A0A9P5XTL9_9AGAR|nr:hypothetical protein BDZ94DRAFT_1241480 [Collybia nuda]
MMLQPVPLTFRVLMLVQPATASYPGSVKCDPPPSGKGDPKCINVSETKSECGFTCHTNYQLNAAKTDCVSTAPPPGPLTLPEDECSTEEGTYLIADPVQGCRCSRTQETGWCGLPTPDSAAMSCKHDAGPTNVRCVVTDCPDNMEPSTTNPTQCVEKDGTPGRMNANTDCATGNVYALPGRAGCKCVLPGQSAPQGATHCIQAVLPTMDGEFARSPESRHQPGVWSVAIQLTQVPPKALANDPEETYRQDIDECWFRSRILSKIYPILFVSHCLARSFV